MKHNALRIALSILLSQTVFARTVPDDVRAFYDRVTSGKCNGGKILQDGFYSQYPGPPSITFAYCQDNATGVVYLHGDGSNFANMDIDCDGLQGGPVDGRCGSSADTQSQTAFKDTVKEYSRKAGNYADDLNANFIPYTVFGNYGNDPDYITFHPTDYGIQPLSVMAVVCGDQLVYGVWGDENGDDGKPVVGEASIALATKCYGKRVNGNKAHDGTDVLYIAFPGSVADTVNKKAHWATQEFDDFEKSISATGDRLIEILKTAKSGGSKSSGTSGRRSGHRQGFYLATFVILLLACHI